MRGVRVLDLSRGIAGEFCARLLCGYGAEVVKVEDPRRPSATRGLPPFLQDQPGPDRGAYFCHLNGGKQSIALDLGSAPGRRAVLALASLADVVIEDLSPGELDELGLGYSSLREVRPDVILTSVTTFGQVGPMRGHKATELGMMAAGGALYITGEPNREPIKPGAYLASHAGGLQAVVATTAALCLRRATGIGRHVDVSIQEAVGMFLSGGPAWVHHFGQTQTRVGARVAQSIVRNAYSGNILRCSDGYQWFGTGHNQDMIGLLVERPELGSPELWHEPGPPRRRDRRRHRGLDVAADPRRGHPTGAGAQHRRGAGAHTRRSLGEPSTRRQGVLPIGPASRPWRRSGPRRAGPVQEPHLAGWAGAVPRRAQRPGVRPTSGRFASRRNSGGPSEGRPRTGAPGPIQPAADPAPHSRPHEQRRRALRHTGAGEPRRRSHQGRASLDLGAARGTADHATSQARRA